MRKVERERKRKREGERKRERELILSRVSSGGASRRGLFAFYAGQLHYQLTITQS
jgi:hypothetical protein